MFSMLPIKTYLKEKKMRFALALTALLAFGVSTATAASFSFNSTELVIAEVTKLFVPILAVIVGAVPLIITLAVSDGEQCFTIAGR